jgi:hypothetical protein
MRGTESLFWLCIIIRWLKINGSAEENGVVMTSELTTYAPDEDEDSDEIVFSPTSLVSKIIMKV